MARRWTSWLGVAYLVAVLLVTFNVVLATWRGWHVGNPLAALPANLAGLTLLAVSGAVVTAVAALSRRGNPLQWWMIASLALWLAPIALSMSLHGRLSDERFWLMAVIVPAIGAAAILVDPALLRRGLLALGVIAGWGSVVAGISDLLAGWPPALAGGEERFGRWLAMAGLEVGEVRFLNGLMLGRVYVGLTCGLLLVYTVRTLLAGRESRWWWLSPAGLVVATAWSFSRTGLLIMVVGLLAATLPWQRLRRGWLIAAVFGLLLLPLLVSPLLRTGVSDGTTAWRFDLWRDYVSRPGMWTPFGSGPQPASLDYADHAHQQLLEAQATGGWLALTGCLAFIVLACLAARSAAPWDNKAAVGVLFGMAAIFQLDVVTFTNTYSVVNNAQLLIIVVLVSAAAASQPRVRELPERSLDVVERGART